MAGQMNRRSKSGMLCLPHGLLLLLCVLMRADFLIPSMTAGFAAQVGGLASEEPGADAGSGILLTLIPLSLRPRVVSRPPVGSWLRP
jgi:hypothetical protein